MRGNSNKAKKQHQEALFHNSSSYKGKGGTIRTINRPDASFQQSSFTQPEEPFSLYQRYVDDGSRSQTPKKVQRSIMHEKQQEPKLNMGPTATQLDYQNQVLRAQQILQHNIGKAHASRSHSRSKQTRNHKDQTNKAQGKSRKIFQELIMKGASDTNLYKHYSSPNKITEDLQLLLPPGINTRDQIIAFLQWQKLQEQQQNSFEKERMIEPQIHAVHEIKYETSPTFNELLNDRHFSSKFGTAENLQTESFKDDWKESMGRESAVFQPYKNLIGKENPSFHTLSTVQNPSAESDLIQKHQHSAMSIQVRNSKDNHKQLHSASIVQLLKKEKQENSQQSIGSIIKVSNEKLSNQHSRNNGPISTILPGSIISDQGYQNSIKSGQGHQIQQNIVVSKVQSMSSGKKGQSFIINESRFHKTSSQKKELQQIRDSRNYRSPQTNFGGTDSEEPSDCDHNQSAGGETNVPTHLAQSQNFSQLISPRKGIVRGTTQKAGNNKMAEPGKKNQDQVDSFNKPLNDEQINNNMPQQQLKHKTLKNGVDGINNSNQKNPSIRTSQPQQAQEKMTNNSSGKQIFSPTMAATINQFQKQQTFKFGAENKSPSLPPKGSSSSNLGGGGGPASQISAQGLNFKKQNTAYSIKQNNIANKDDSKKNEARQSDGATVQETLMSTQEPFITNNKNDDTRLTKDRNTKEYENQYESIPLQKQKLIKKEARKISTIPLVVNNSNKLSFGHYGDPHQIDGAFQNMDFGRQQTPFGGVGAVGAKIKGSFIDGSQYPGIKRISTLKMNKIKQGDHWDAQKDALYSSNDYIDVDMNDAMKLGGYQMLTGRGRNFEKKNFIEDRWSSDESKYTKQMKMPNVKANQYEYQKEIGLKLTGEQFFSQNADAVMANMEEENKKMDQYDELRQARQMLPEKAFYKIVKKDRIQIIDDYQDRCPCLNFRKQIMKLRVYINRGSQLIMMHSLFESISISVIVVNSLFLAMDDPLRDPSETPYYMELADDIFQYLYTVEMVVKIVSMGFICNKGSYLRDAWNILDFVIIASGYMGMFLQGSGVNLSALRSFRVIRPLRTISSVAGLRVIVSSLINALPLFRDSLLVLMFFFLVFAIAGCQLFTGALKNRCFNEATGVIDTKFTKYCGGGNVCRNGYYCAKSNENPANGATNFDNVAFSLLQVFQVTTLEGWTPIMVALMQSVGTWIFVYFYPIIFIGSFFLLNLTLAVIKAKFTEEMNNKQETGPVKKKKKLDDATESSEDDDVQALAVNQELRRIKKAKNLSPRSRENKINGLRIGHLIWKVDTILQQRDAAIKVVERIDEKGKLTPTLSPINRSREGQKPGTPQSSVYNRSQNEKFKTLSAADKISIFKKHQSPDNLVGIQKYKSRNPFQPNYSQVFHSEMSSPHPSQNLGLTSNIKSQNLKHSAGIIMKSNQKQLLPPQITEGRLSKYNEEQQELHKLKDSNKKPDLVTLQVPNQDGQGWEKVNWSTMQDDEDPKIINSKRSMISTTSFQVENNVHLQNSPNFFSAGFQIMKQSFQGDRAAQTHVSPPITQNDKKIIFAGINNQNSSILNVQAHNPSRNSGGFANNGSIVSSKIARHWYKDQENSKPYLSSNVPKIVFNMNNTNENLQGSNYNNQTQSDAADNTHLLNTNQDEQMGIYEKITQNFDIFEFIENNGALLSQKQQTNKQQNEPENMLSKIKRQRSKTLIFGKHDDQTKGEKDALKIAQQATDSLESSFIEDVQFDIDEDDLERAQSKKNKENDVGREQITKTKGAPNLIQAQFRRQLRKDFSGSESSRRGEQMSINENYLLNQKDLKLIKSRTNKSKKRASQFIDGFLSINQYQNLSPFSKNHIQRQKNIEVNLPQIDLNHASISKKVHKPRFIREKQEKGLASIFRTCKKMKVTQDQEDYREEFIQLRQRALSQKYFQQAMNEMESRFISDLSFLNKNAQKEELSQLDMCLPQNRFKPNSVRGKSIEIKKQRMLAESAHFNERQKIMKERRTTFFAHAIKSIGVKRELGEKEYEDYVMKNRKIKINPDLMNEQLLKKRVLYRSASTEAIILASDNKANKKVIQYDIQNSFNGVVRIKHIDDECNMSLLQERQMKQMMEEKLQKDLIKAKKMKFEEIPDMDQILQERQMKIIVKMSNLKFKSIKDIFQESGAERFLSAQEKRDLENNRKKEAAMRAKFGKKKEVSKNVELIAGYQKKILVRGKSFYEELLKNEYIPSDEDQDGMLIRIEDEFNYDHRSHIYVTGTLSVVVNKHSHHNKILNENYHANIRSSQGIQTARKSPISQQRLAAKQFQESLPIQPSIETHQRVNSSRKGIQQSIESNAVSSNLQVIQQQSKLLKSPKYQDQWKKSSLSNSYMGRNNMKLGSSLGFILSMKRHQESQQISTNMKQQINKVLPNPEAQTDKKLLKVLNSDFQSSRIFQGINYKVLPTEIFGKSTNDGEKKKRKKKKGDISEDEVLLDEESDTEKKKRSKRVDFFLQREFDGLTHIQIAKSQVIKRAKDEVEWSGQDVLSKLDPYKARLGVQMLNIIRVWPYHFHGLIKKWRVALKKFMDTPLVEHGMTLCVIGNTVVLSLDYYGASQSIQDACATANTFFTLTFATEMFSRILAIGPEKWLSDKMNYMDGTIVLLSLVELAFMSGSGALSALRAVRIFRVFRVLRVARLLRGLKSMVQIINVIQRSISSFIYLAMLLLLFVFIYALLGMQMFGGSFKDPEVAGTIRYNYDSFLNSFITSFIMLTTENWNTIMFYAFSGESSQALIAVYFVSCIFIGNWMLLNLFLAILLDAFAQVDEEDTMTPEKKEDIKDHLLEALKFKKGEDFIEGMEELQMEGFNLKSDKKKTKKKKKIKKKVPPQPQIVQKTAAVAPAQQKSENNSKSQANTTIQTTSDVHKPKPIGNILDESQEVGLEELEKRQQENLAQRKLLFRGIECENSCYLFSKQNFFRQVCYRVAHHGKFESFIMLLIVCSSFKLVFDTYLEGIPLDSPIIVYSSRIDMIFQIFFTIEMLLKIVSFGFMMDENSYLQESWSQMDFFIVVTGLIDTSLEGVDIAFLKVLRLLRILRPLRFLSHSSSMKTMIEALMASVPSIANVGVVILIVFLMFAILGVNLFAGKLQYCKDGYYQVNTMEECFKMKSKWVIYDLNMDNVVSAMMTLFAVSNNEGWPDTMYAYSDATGVGTGPKPGAGLSNAFFFIAFVFIGSFFFLNLFTGVLFMNFEKAQRDEKDAMHLDGEEVRWVDMMKMICAEQPDIVRIPKGKIRRWCFDLVRQEGQFANFIMACIIMNIVTMAITFEGMSKQYSGILEKINYFFTAAFAIECAFKLIGHGGNYFNSAWNKFDFFVVSASFLDIVMDNLSANSLKVIRVGPQLARIMRVMRVSRLFKLLNKYKGLQALIQTITFSLPSVINAFALLSLVYFIFSVLAVFFFKDITQGLMIDDYMNFKNFTQSLVMMLRLSTGEDWQMVMFDMMNVDLQTCIQGKTCGTSYAPIFFILFVLIQQYIMVDLFVLIILQQFDLYYLPDDNVLDRFKRDLDNFKFVWKKYSQEFDGFKIRGKDVQKFFMDLKDLGMANEKSQKAIERNLVMMNIQADDEQCIYFNELLYKTMKRRYASGRTKKKVLYELELDTLEKLEKIMTEQIFASRKKERLKAVAVNPFLAMMYQNMSFNVWRQIYEKNLPKRQAHILLGLDREISEEDEENVSNIEGDQSMITKKMSGDNGETYYCYETEDDQIVEEERIEDLNLQQYSGAVTPKSPHSFTQKDPAYGKKITIRNLINKEKPFLQRGDLLYFSHQDIEVGNSNLKHLGTRHTQLNIKEEEPGDKEKMKEDMNLRSMRRLIQTVNMDMKLNRISKIGEVAAEGEADQEDDDDLKESIISDY